MTRKNKIYQSSLIALLFCILQIAGIDVYAQTPIKAVTQDSIIQREAPKARARRHREPANEKTMTDSLNKDKILHPTDSLHLTDSLKATAIVVADSLEKVNNKNLKKIESPVTIVKKDSIPVEIPKTLFIPSPSKATWLAVVFPGGGQIYNRKYWKLPIIYGGFAGCAYALSWNSKMYKDYTQAYLDIIDNNPNTNSYQDLLPPNANYDTEQLKSILRKRKDTFRRYRDLSIFAFIGVYLISIVDAYVDAELSNFDISPDLSMRIEPTVINDQIYSSRKAVGVQCVLRF